jgi:BlaI family transcriptional regulator, penicillinase repressor
MVAKAFANAASCIPDLDDQEVGKMARSASSQPTAVELQILGILWDLGPCPVRDIHKRLEAAKGTNYSTTVKMLAVMLDKGLLKRDETVRPHVYRVAEPRQRTQKRMLATLIDRVFDGSSMTLILQALSSRPASKSELEAIRRLIDRLEAKSP